MQQFKRLDAVGNSYSINNPVAFRAVGQFPKDILIAVFDFAYKMAFSTEGEHRAYRSGGMARRRNGQIFANTLQGKLAEYAMYLQLHDKVAISAPDLSTYGLGQWDVTDLVIHDKKVSVKSTKCFGNLLLLETKDWNYDGRHIPNDEAYDLTFLVRLDPNCEDLMKRNRLLYVDTVSYDTLKAIILGEAWKYDIPGFITLPELQYLIRNQYILPQNALLNGRIPMDAENYYVQAGDMHRLDELLTF